jgi:hypothetical protein
MPEAAALVDHSRTTGPSVAAVDASMLGHEAASFEVKSAQKPCSSALPDALVDALVDAPAEAAMLGDATSLGEVTGATDGAVVGDEVPEQAASPIAEPTIRPMMVRFADMGSPRVGDKGRITSPDRTRGRVAPGLSDAALA